MSAFVETLNQSEVLVKYGARMAIMETNGIRRFPFSVGEAIGAVECGARVEVAFDGDPARRRPNIVKQVKRRGVIFYAIDRRRMAWKTAAGAVTAAIELRGPRPRGWK